jgi:uncharacterized Zn finger protein (UPF0148 family)
MFCNKCGTKLSDGATFCASCGAAQNGVVAVGETVTVTADSEKATVMEKINGSFEVMKAMKEKEDAISKCSEEHNELETKQNGKKTARTVAYIVCGIFIVSGLGSLRNGGIAIIVICAIVIACLVGSVKKRKARMTSLIEEIGRYSKELEVLKNDGTIQWLPYDYRDSTAFAYIYSYLTNLRASNLKEAINLYETEKHQQRLESMQALTAAAAVNAADSARSAATSSAISAVVSFFDLFK